MPGPGLVPPEVCPRSCLVRGKPCRQPPTRSIAYFDREGPLSSGCAVDFAIGWTRLGRIVRLPGPRQSWGMLVNKLGNSRFPRKPLLPEKSAVPPRPDTGGGQCKRVPELASRKCLLKGPQDATHR